MQINNECVRDILFVIEEKSTFKYPCRMIGIKRYPVLLKYEDDVIQYHLRYLTMKKMIFQPNKDDDFCYDLTPEGHEFISNIREETNWNKIKGISSSIGFASLKMGSAIAEGVATAAINQQLGLAK